MNKLLFFALVLLATGCKEKFISPAPAVVTGYLVIEGVINNGGVTSIHLSRTTSLNDNSNVPENGAIVKLMYSNNNSMLLMDGGGGNYTMDSIQLDTTLKYQLYIKTANNEEYLSDYATVKQNPPIDTISWTMDKEGVHLFINTHDPANKTLYYQWDYNETWEFHSTYPTVLKYLENNGINVGVTKRDASDPRVYTCWQSNASSILLLGSTAKLNQDIVHLPLTNVELNSWKISVLYSILVKQYAWTKEGYEFLERMKKNTESVGSVFDAQPSELNGNIHCTSNPNLPVIGFFNICSIREQRLFIKNSEVPGWNYDTGCIQQIIENDPDSIAKKADGLLPTSVVKEGPFGSIITFNASAADCVDCTLKGTNIKPAFWP